MTTDNKYAQGLTWALKKQDLERMLQEAGDKYTHLEFKLVVDEKCVTRYFIALVSTDEEGCTQVNVEHKICPSPPGCPDGTN